MYPNLPKGLTVATQGASVKTRSIKMSIAALCGLCMLGFAAGPASAQEYVIVTPLTITEAPAVEAGSETGGIGTGVDPVAGAATPDDEVLGITQTAGGLAHTGSEVSVPAAGAAALIGLGGLALLASRKRESQA